MAIAGVSERGGKDRENAAVVRRYMKQVYSKGEFGALEELVAPDIVGESIDSPIAYLEPDGIRAHVARLRSVFGGFTIVVNNIHVVDERFEVSWTAFGTHERRFLGIDPTCIIGQAGEEPHGNQIAVEGITTGTMNDGRIQRFRMAWDVIDLRRQLGAPLEVTDHDSDLVQPSVPTR